MRGILACVSVLTLVVLASPHPTPAAQTFGSDDVIVVEVPFDFVAGDRQLPAGTYRVEIAPNDVPPALVTLQTAAKGEQPDDMLFQRVATSRVKVDEVDRLGEQPRLVFSKVGTLHFLERVVTPS